MVANPKIAGRSRHRAHLDLVQCCDLLFVAFVVCLVYLPATVQSGWSSDDYELVFGIDKEIPTWVESLRLGGQGKLSVARLLCYPFIGYLGEFLGPQWSHVLAIILHLLCALTFYFLLRRLQWTHVMATTAMLLFSLAPWATQPVVWWSAVCTIVSSLIFLLAVHAFTTWYQRPRPVGFLIASQLLTFVALLFYELWLGSFALFWMLGLHFERRESTRERRSSTWSDLIWRTTRRSWPMMMPYVFWAVLYLATYPLDSGIRTPHAGLWRILVTFLSIHLRIYHWFSDTPWLTALLVGLDGVLTPLSLIFLTLVFAMASFIYYLRSQDKWAAQRGEVVGRPPPDVVSMVLIAWGLFLGSRVAFVLQGGVATHTRHSYGAAMAFAAATSWFLWWLWKRYASRVNVRRLLGGAEVLVVIILAVTTSGLAFHASRVSRAEDATFKFLRDAIDGLPRGQDILIVGDPTESKGELPYYREEYGGWLQYRLRENLHGRRVYVLGSMSPGTTTMRLVRLGKAESISPNQATVFRWHRGQLVREN